ncbi:hypothetical protein K435DRAFT_836182 [Dendrothele bispora CBS 962.96]|uniref:histidine kinase n=1 Tax=Dendrothele bispora (strain CBS 962.96) TaxID=1314807 RepID=A0A4S8MJM4_DENBC|nr:hypothetical protein K435DRAFT_836182 [Dendrothele bispora CBS 962.96]
MESARSAHPISDSLQFPVQSTSALTSDAPSSSKTMLTPQKRARKISRPSTAPAKEDVILLPSQIQKSSGLHSPSGNVTLHPMQTVTEDDGSDHSNSRPHSMPPTPLADPSSSQPTSSVPPMTEGHMKESSIFPSTQTNSFTPEIQPQQLFMGPGSLHQLSATPHPPSTHSRYNYGNLSYDWVTFISAYSSGRWDPHRTPNPPAYGIGPSFGTRSVPLIPEIKPKFLGVSQGGQEVDLVGQYYNGTEHGRVGHVSNSSSKSPQDSTSHSHFPSSPHPKLVGSHRLRNSFSASTSLPSSSPSRSGKQPQPHPLGPSLSTSSAGVNGHGVYGDAKSQKAKADLFLPLPHRLPLTPAGFSPGGQPLLSPSPVTAALHSNALYSNSPHPHSSSSSSLESRPGPGKVAPPHMPVHSSTAPPPSNSSNKLPVMTPSRLTHIASTSGLSTTLTSRMSATSLPSNSFAPHASAQTSQAPRLQDLPHATSINAAALRLAGSNVNISPLALPSPEHELTDPMRAVCVPVPGTVRPEETDSERLLNDGNLSDGVITEGASSVSATTTSGREMSRLHTRNTSSDLRKLIGEKDKEFGEGTDSTVTTPGGSTRRARISTGLKKFWEGTTDVDQPRSGLHLPPSKPVTNDQTTVTVIDEKLPSNTSDDLKGKSRLQQTPSPLITPPMPQKTQLSDGDDDYFTRGREFSAAAYQNERFAPQVVPPTPDAIPISQPVSAVESSFELSPIDIDTHQLSSSPTPATPISNHSSASASSLSIAPVSIPAPLLSSYSFPYTYSTGHVLMHPTGAMTVPVPPASVPGSSVDEQPEPDTVPNPPRRINLSRQISAPLPVGSGSRASFGGKMGQGIGMPPQLLPSVEDMEKASYEFGDPATAHEARSGSAPPPSADLLPNQPLSDPTTPVRSEISESTDTSRYETSTTVSTISASVSLASFGSMSSMATRAAKEEQMFHDLGYLIPPNPPDETERRRALYKFNIWNTGSDLNFDRIAHLAKLVFNTKGVFISLLDGNEQWFKSEWGLKTNTCIRSTSFCGHTILQRDDEPMVILDTLQDWRFAKNPHVIGTPHIRFYAGAPLRTQDGFNIGSLAVIDDAPRDEFTPRHRHTLKEFAAIAMREMELWRDKIQLRIRDRIQSSMEQFSRECLEIDMEEQSQTPGNRNSANPSPEPRKEQSPQSNGLLMPSSMDKVYDRAAKLVQRTLDVEGVIVMDVSHCEVLESMSGEGSVSVVMHHGDPDVQETTSKSLTSEEYSKLNAFFAKYPDGKISEGIVPPSFRQFLPTRIQYALTVPIFNIDKRPFALLCAYNVSDHTKRFLEGHELSYLRAIGVIILSAVLKRRMILADKAKGLFISNISHELRTPLHGILAAAELLSDTHLDHSQSSFLQTVQACGTSLVETVNHVLDFTKLSGNSKAGGVENVIVPTKVDLMQLVEEAIDGCWIGHRARTVLMDETGIGSVYSPPKEDNSASRRHVETVVDIGGRKEGWFLKCEKGGIRRVLMNVFGNSLKFTSDGFIHVMLRQLPPSEGDPPSKVKIELAVLDTGKGISQNFLKNQLFHPFSQENPLQTGTGLGLAIVNSIVTSESVGGKVDVWSEEGVGTEIKITFFAECPDEPEEIDSPEGVNNVDSQHTISLVGFDSPHPGVQLLRSVLKRYITERWGLSICPSEQGYGDIIILNEDIAPLIAATQRRDASKPFLILSSTRGGPELMSAASEHELIGGFCRFIHKPGGPSRIWQALNLCLQSIKIKSQNSSPQGQYSEKQQQEVNSQAFTVNGPLAPAVPPRRNSEEKSMFLARPSMGPRANTVHPTSSSSWRMSVLHEKDEKEENDKETPDPDTIQPTITVGSGGTLLKSSVGALQPNEKKIKILVVEDNNILRNLLVKWLKSKGYDFRDAVDGRDGVNVYSKEGPFDVVLLDLSMPVLDGIGATAEIRQIETSHFSAKRQEAQGRHSRILALTGMSSLEDKRKAFEAGVDGYLVKPVAFKTLDEMFHKLGIS